MRTKLLLLLFIPVLTSCQNYHQNIAIEEEVATFDYSDFSDLKIEWKNLFSPAKSHYFVYIYSISCGHCNRIKEDVLTYISANKEMFYLIEYSNEIATKSNVAETIGKEKIEEISILGTPTLLAVTNWSLSLNIAGEKEIVDYLNGLPHKEKCSN